MQKLDFNTGWKYKRITAGDWRNGEYENITIPHDAMIREPRSENNPGGKNTGWFSGSDYLYTKHFFVPKEYKENKIIFEFEGVYHNAEVYINGGKAASHAYGYTGFYVDAGDMLKFGEENIIDVAVKNSDQPNSRWYSGAGIYRPVWMYTSGREYIPPTGVMVSTVGICPAEVKFKICTSTGGVLNIQILDGDSCLAEKEINSQGQAEVRIQLPAAQLWSPKTPKLYTYKVTFANDLCEGTFGIRQIEWSAAKGLLLNGERILLKGACIHHDNGLLGACCYKEAESRKITLLLQMGYNAIRSAHNPCSKALLDACDRLGMLVLDEYTDMWYIHKTAFDYAENMPRLWEQDLRDMIEKDYNHPSVIMYSTGNEVSETAQPKGIELTRAMTDYIHTLDGTRPVTCGINIFFNLLSSMGFGVYNDKKAKKALKDKSAAQKKRAAVGSEFYNNLAGIFGAAVMKRGAALHGCDVKTRDAYKNMDIAGYNYGILRYKRDLKKYKDRLILGSETFCSDAYKFYEMARREPRIIGDFVWSGMDYIGETGVGAWEYEDYAPKSGADCGWLTAGSGRLDITGNELGEADYTKVAFEYKEGPFIAVRPVYQAGKHSPSAWKMTNAMKSWSWNGCNGMKAVVEVYTRAAEAEILINGKSKGRKKRGKDCKIIFNTIYEDGELSAIVYDGGGAKMSETSLVTAGEETVLKIIPEEETAAAGKLCFVRLSYTDNAGVKKPMEQGEISISVKGGTVMGFGNACPYNPDGYLKSAAKTYYGEALAVIKAENEESIFITATDGRLTSEYILPVAAGR